MVGVERDRDGLGIDVLDPELGVPYQFYAVRIQVKLMIINFLRLLRHLPFQKHAMVFDNTLNNLAPRTVP